MAKYSDGKYHIKNEFIKCVENIELSLGDCAWATVQQLEDNSLTKIFHTMFKYVLNEDCRNCYLAMLPQHRVLFF